MEALTGMWVNFFAAAGIPSDVGATYSLTFTENRIQSDMLLDLNKEYLRDMGITRMGDVIAILRHAKLVHESTARERVLNSAGSKVPVAAVAARLPITQNKPTTSLLSSATSKVPVPAVAGRLLGTENKPTSPVTRMLEHYTRNVSQLEVPEPSSNVSVKRKITQVCGNSKNTEESSVKKIRQLDVKPCSSATLLCEGTVKKNVFSRLGGSTEGDKLEQVTIETEAFGKNVFSRLGSKNIPVSVDNTVRSVKQEVHEQVLQYEGILKSQPEIKKAPNTNTTPQTVFRKPIQIGTMRADQAPVSAKEKIALSKTKCVKFSNFVSYKEIEAIPKKRIFFQSEDLNYLEETSENPIFNKPERRLSMPSVLTSPQVKSRLGTKQMQSLPKNVFTRLGAP